MPKVTTLALHPGVAGSEARVVQDMDEDGPEDPPHLQNQGEVTAILKAISRPRGGAGRS